MSHVSKIAVAGNGRLPVEAKVNLAFFLAWVRKWKNLLSYPMKGIGPGMKTQVTSSRTPDFASRMEYSIHRSGRAGITLA